MPVDKIVRTFVQPPLGLNKRASALTLSPDSAIENVNVDYQETLEGDIITQRLGVSMAPGPIWEDGISLSSGNDEDPPTMGIFSYQSTNQDTGEDESEIIAIQRTAHRVEEIGITISNSGAGTRSCSLLPHPTLSNKMLMTLTDSADPGSPYVWTFDGDENLWDFKTNYIDTTANFSLLYHIGNITGSVSALACTISGSVVNNIEITFASGSFTVGDEICQTSTANNNMPAWLVTKSATNKNWILSGAIPTFGNGDVLIPSWLNRITMRCFEYSQSSFTFYGRYTRRIFSVNTGATTSSIPWGVASLAGDGDDYRSFSSVNSDNCLYIGNPSYIGSSSDPVYRLMKYDGKDVYQAGLPKPVIASISRSGSGSTDAGTRIYRVSYVYTDYQGNEIESELSDEYEFVVSTTGRVEITLIPPTNISFMQKLTFYDGSTLTGVNTVPLYTAFDMYVPGDVIYFRDSAYANYWEGWQTRTITSCINPHTGNDEITFDGAAATIVDSTVFTCGRARIYRTRPGGTELYLSAEVNMTTVVNDSVSDATLLTLAAAGGPLGVRYIAPEANQERTLLEDGPRYLAKYRGSLICAGFYSKPIEVACSVPGSPEYFPPTLKFNVGNESNDAITGIAVLGQSLIIGKENSIYVVTGEVLSAVTGLPTLRVDLLTNNLGVASNDAMIVVDNSLFFLSKEDVYMMAEGGRPQSIGSAIKPFLKSRDYDETKKLRFARSRLAYDPIAKRLFVWVPAIDRPGTGAINSNSVFLTLDMERNTWQKWEDVYFDKGAFWSVKDNSFFFSSINELTPRGIRKFRNGDPVFDTYDELNTPISFELQTGFDNLGKLTSQKKFQKSKIWATQGAEAPDFTLNVSTYTNYDDQTVKTSLPLTFDANNRRGIVPLVPERAEGLAYKFTHSTAGEKVKLLGWEHEVIVDAMEKLEPKRRG